MQTLELPPLLGASGSVRLPGSKSISNRVLLLAALGRGKCTIRDVLVSDDTERMIEALTALGVPLTRTERTTIVIDGVGGRFPTRDADLFLGNAGTAFRPLTAVLALAGGHYRLSGVARMHERPIGDLVDGLRQLGAVINYQNHTGYPPLSIEPASGRAADTVTVRGNVSSQFVTALLMALPLRNDGCPATVIEVVGDLISRPYINITLALMARFGVRVETPDPQRFVVPAAGYTNPDQCFVEADASSASYFLAAGAIGGGPVRVEGVGRDSIQGDVRFADALAQMGARLTMGDNWIEASAPEDLPLRAFDLDLNHIPDAAMTLAAAALFADGPCTLRNIESWRVKETDRIEAMATELRKVGATVTVRQDGITVSPPAQLARTCIDTYDDHRMAMCLSLATLGGVGQTINDPGCVNKTFPDYFERLNDIALPVPVIAIDGPSASGKGTVAAKVADALGWHYLDSGSLYRVTALAAMRAHCELDDEGQLGRLAAALPVTFDGPRVLLDGDDVTAAIRTEAVSQGASQVAALTRVRTALLDRQRAFWRAPGLVAEGRDIGSVVFPNAAHKFFLTASVEVRAQRRHKQLMDKGMPANLDSLSLELQMRDDRDRQRAVAPLKRLPDATLLDTTHMDVEQAVSFVLERLNPA